MKKYIVSRETLEKWKYTGLIKYIPTDLQECHYDGTMLKTISELRKRVEELEKHQYNCQYCLHPLDATKPTGIYDPNCLKNFPNTRSVQDILDSEDRLRTALEEIRDHHGENKYTKLCDIADEALKGEK